MFDTKAFKQAVLNQAMQGKLTQQLPEDGNASELLQSIDNEKQRLIKEGKIKKQKALPDIDHDEVPFEIPDNWQWVRLGNVINISTGFSFKKSSYIDSGTMIVRISDFNQSGIIKKRPAFVKFNDKLSKFLLNPGDILMAMTGGTVGKVSPVIFPKTKILLNQRVARFDSMYLDNYFLNYYLRSSYVQNKVQFNKNSTNDNISMSFLNNLVFPLPPLAEQQRIVNQIDKCFKLADSIDDEHELNRNFSTNMHTSLLNAAMQGKLTKQLPEDGSASDLLNLIKEEKQRLINEGKIKKQKALPDIDPDDIPFEIPNSWKWVQLGSIVDYIQKGITPKYTSDGIPVLNQRCVQWSGIIFDNHKNVSINDFRKLPSERTLKEGDILWNTTGTGTLGRLSIVTKKLISDHNNMVVSGDVMIIRANRIVNSNFILKYLSSAIVQRNLKDIITGSTNQIHLNLSAVLPLLIPLPPLAEQQRIVKNLDSIFDKINKI